MTFYLRVLINIAANTVSLESEGVGECVSVLMLVF